jgi:hypothetical protein
LTLKKARHVVIIITTSVVVIGIIVNTGITSVSTSIVIVVAGCMIFS